MGVVRGGHGNKWRDFFHRSGAYLTWRGITLPRSPVPLARRGQQPHVPPPRLGDLRQCGGGQDDGRRCPAPQLLHLHPENRDHHQPPAPVARQSGNHGHKCARSGTIGARRATKPKGNHGLRPVHLHPAHNHQLTTPTAGHRCHTDYGRSGTIGGRHTTEPPTRTCIQTGGATTPTTTPRSHSGSGAPGITCREWNRAQPHEYGGSRQPTRATPWHRRPANEPRLGPSRRPSSTTPNTTRRIHTRPPAGGPPGGGNTGLSGAPSTPRPTNQADRGPHTRAVRRPSHTNMYRYPDRRHQRPAARHRAPPRPQLPPRAPVPKLRRHPAHRPPGATCRRQHKPGRHPNSTTTHQPGRRYSPQKQNLAVARSPARAQTQTRTRRGPQSRLRPRG